MIIIFVTFEGIDGAGLSTQAALLNDYLIKNGKQCVLTKEPTNNIVGGIIRAGLRGEWKVNNLTIQNLFAADRSHHLETEIEPALKKRKIVRPGTVKAALVLSLSMLSAGMAVQNIFFMVFGSITGVGSFALPISLCIWFSSVMTGSICCKPYSMA